MKVPSVTRDPIRAGGLRSCANVMFGICRVVNRRRTERMMSICLTRFPIIGLGEPNLYHNLEDFTRMWGFYLEGSEHGLDYWGGFWQEV